MKGLGGGGAGRRFWSLVRCGARAGRTAGLISLKHVMHQCLFPDKANKVIELVSLK
jgi:hypothetical protein